MGQGGEVAVKMEEGVKVKRHGKAGARWGEQTRSGAIGGKKLGEAAVKVATAKS